MDDVILNKLATLKRCLDRINQEFTDEQEFKQNFTKQDSVILNIQRACEASIDISNRIIRLMVWGVPQSAREVFIVLEKEKVIETEIAVSMQKMVGFRNIAVHDYQALNIDIVIHIVKHCLNDFKRFSKQILSFMDRL